VTTRGTTKSVAVLGTGIMGAGMARNIAAAGLDTTVWNRSPDKARPLADAGARVATDPVDAVSAADVVMTMLFDADSVAAVVEPLLPRLRPDAVWLQTSTVGLEGTQRLAGLAERHGVAFVDAPVLGTRQPAEQGALTVLAGGPEDVREAVVPVLDAIGSRTVWVGERAGDGHRLKLAANSWMLSIVGATAQALGLARGLGIDPALFLEAVAGGPLDCPYVQLKGRSMIAEEFPPAFPLAGAVKDTELIADAQRAAGTDDALMRLLHDRFAAAAAAGHADEDLAAVWYAVRG
jgi:3-hydroxyisobutyrate dehydrogenase